MNKHTVRLIEGETALGPVFEGCHNLFVEWFNKERIFLPMGDFDPFPISLDDAKKYVESHKKDTWIVFAKQNENWLPIGYTGLFIRQRHKVGIVRYAICDDLFLEKGHATRACKLVTKWAFDECGLEVLTASVSDSNKSSCKVLLKNDFTQCGKHSLVRFETGLRYDEHHFEILRETFYTKSNA
jgi:RimJ/RimL family protein N-acetyltransferase